MTNRPIFITFPYYIHSVLAKLCFIYRQHPVKQLLMALMATLLVSIGAVWAGALEDGTAAYRSGDYTSAVKWYRLAAEQGDAKAQNNLAAMFSLGRGVAQDYVEAVKWYQRAAEQGDAAAQNNLGAMFEQGQGVPQNYEDAVKWYRLAAEQGHAAAQKNLGTMYEQGQGVAQDFKEAVKWFQRAAQQGHAAAQNNLGAMHGLGQGVAIQSFKEAVKWYRLAAVQWNADAQNNLAAMYFLGQGVPRDYVRAYMWSNLAAITGDTNSVKLADLAAAMMTPTQIAEGQNMALACRQQNLQGCD